MRRITARVLLGLACSFACTFASRPVTAGDAAGGPTNSPARLSIVATILPVYCVATQVAGDCADVRYLLGSAGDAHDFQLTPRDRSAIESARLILMNGLGVESWLQRVIESKPGIPVVELAAGLEKQLIRTSPSTGFAGRGRGAASEELAANPHVWLDPILMCHMVTNAVRALQIADPVNANRYATNGMVYVSRLRDLDQRLERGLRDLRGRPIVTYHDAFPYFARRYGLRVVGVVEEVSDIDPTPRQLSALAVRIRTEEVRALFVEPHHPETQVRRLAIDLHVRVGVLDTLETGAGRPSAYEEGMLANLQALQNSLR